MSETKKHPGGRPTKYREDMPERLKDYVDSGFKSDGDVIPTKAGFAVKVEVCEKTLDNWGAEHPEFLRMIRYLLAEQHKILMNKGLAGDFNSVISKLLLSSDHGHRERSEHNLKGVIGTRELSKDEAAELLQDTCIDCEDAIAG